MNYQIITFTDKDFSLDVRVTLEEKMIWLNQQDFAKLFNKSQSSISRHINALFKNGVLLKERVYAKIEYTGGDGKTYNVDFYNANVLIKLGEKFNSKRYIQLLNFVENYFVSLNKTTPMWEDIIIYDNGNIKLSVEITPEEETVWLNQDQIAMLFETTQQNVNLHIGNILKEQELPNSVHKYFLYTGPDKKKYLVKFYNLDMILAVGYRINLKVRKLVSKVLKTTCEANFKGENI